MIAATNAYDVAAVSIVCTTLVIVARIIFRRIDW